MLLLATLPAAAASGISSEAEVDAYVRRVMQAVGRGDINAAYTALKAYSVLSPAEIDAGAKATAQQRTPDFVARYGRTLGMSYIGKKKLGDALLRITYIERAANHPLPWTFYFYLTPDGWVLSQFGWSDQSTSLFVLN
ncbi:MAG TPA: hypothetical protein VGE51_10690 [Fontimonas sp.]